MSELRQVKRYRHISLSLYDRRFGSTRCLSDKTIHVIYAKVVATYIDIIFGRVHFLSVTHTHTRTRIYTRIYTRIHTHICTRMHTGAPYSHTLSRTHSLSLFHCINIPTFKNKREKNIVRNWDAWTSSRTRFMLAISTLNTTSISATTYKR